jgi:hypothetical protein
MTAVTQDMRNKVTELAMKLPAAREVRETSRLIA